MSDKAYASYVGAGAATCIAFWIIGLQNVVACMRTPVPCDPVPLCMVVAALGLGAGLIWPLVWLVSVFYWIVVWWA